MVARDEIAILLDGIFIAVGGIDMDTNIEEGVVFASQEAILLKRAFFLALDELGPEFDLDESAKSKLAKIVTSVAQKRTKAGGGLISDEDAADVAAVSCSRFIGLKAD